MRGLILVNAYTQSEHELNQPRRIQAELAALGVAKEGALGPHREEVELVALL